MFTVPTTIILGAGASCGYGYPLGHDLIDAMIRVCDGWAKRIGPIASVPRRLSQMLAYYDPISIDAFLTHYAHDAELVTCAKKAITEILLASNRADRFTRPKPAPGQEHHHWYRFLWSALTAGQAPEQLADENGGLNLNIVTFNYDPGNPPKKPSSAKVENSRNIIRGGST